MLFVPFATLAVAFILQPTMSNVSSTPTWESLPVEQRLPPLAKEGYVDHEGARIWYGTAAEGDHEEFIIRAHTDYLAATIPGAKLIILPNVSHFAPWQDPTTFNKSILQFIHD